MFPVLTCFLLQAVASALQSPPWGASLCGASALMRQEGRWVLGQAGWKKGIKFTAAVSMATLDQTSFAFCWARAQALGL